jgi:hypothetical protein
MFAEIFDGQRRPALFHSTTGKHRTGWAAAATLTLLGVFEEDVLADFLIANRDLLPALKPYFDRFASVGGDPALLTLSPYASSIQDDSVARARFRFSPVGCPRQSYVGLPQCVLALTPRGPEARTLGSRRWRRAITCAIASSTARHSFNVSCISIYWHRRSC